MAGDAVLGLDIGGTKILAARVAAGRVLEAREAETPRPATPDAVIDRTVALVDDWTPDGASIGVASAGAVANGRVTAVTRVVLRGWTDVPLAQILERRTGLPTTAPANDGQAAAWGEFRHGAGRGRDRLLFMTVSTGVGGGVVEGGRLLLGTSGLAGHVGHLSVDPDGPWCTCGRRGCLEQLVSGSAIARQAEDLLGTPTSAREVFAWAAEGEPWAEGLVRASARRLALGISSLHMLFDPGLVVLGGGVGLAEGYLDAVRAELATIPVTRGLEVVPASLGRYAGVIGAAEFAEEARRGG